MLVATLCISSVAVHTVIGQKSDRGRSRIRDAENSILIAIDAPVIIPRLRGTVRIINVMSGWDQT
jgi:predicted RNase H-like nuclease